MTDEQREAALKFLRDNDLPKNVSNELTQLLADREAAAKALFTRWLDYENHVGFEATLHDETEAFLGLK
jgi:hypothetical protein